jgi:hypothetical protein
MEQIEQPAEPTEAPADVGEGPAVQVILRYEDGSRRLTPNGQESSATAAWPAAPMSKAARPSAVRPQHIDRGGRQRRPSQDRDALDGFVGGARHDGLEHRLQVWRGGVVNNKERGHRRAGWRAGRAGATAVRPPAPHSPSD